MTPLIGRHVGIGNKLREAFWQEISGFLHQKALKWLAKELPIYQMTQQPFCPDIVSSKT